MKKRINPYGLLIKDLIKTKANNQKDLDCLKREFSKRFEISCPDNISLLRTYHTLVENKRIKESRILENLLKKRPVRSLSGIVNISVLTSPKPSWGKRKPYSCPGRCVFCPAEKEFPKSYLPGEPAAERAKNLGFDPFLQVSKRLEMLKAQGHCTDKIELRIIGGTWSFYPKQYQTWFVKRCFQACNKKSLKFKTQSLKTAQRLNEKAENRIVGISIETKPSFVTEKEILRLRGLGVTLVELGIQTVFDDVLTKCKTDITIAQIARATKLLKDTGFKILYQVMPNLPGSNLKKDLKCFEILFEDEEFLPDWLKIYPCLVCKNSLLYQWWKKGKYRPYSNKELVELLVDIKKNLPYWTRVTRLFRDIPAPRIKAGSKLSNLREVVQKELKQKGLTCKCIRCREVRKDYNLKEKIYLFRKNYKSSEGKEIFLSFENKQRKKLFSFLRLRIPSFYFSKKSHFIKTLEGASIIREIQTFGMQVPISEKKLAPQHRGLGKKLIKKAEKITKEEFELKKIAVISGIGVRMYYKNLGYQLKQTYMIKPL